jgi:ribosomal protein S18 acetylase RimI-like enzyme
MGRFRMSEKRDAKPHIVRLQQRKSGAETCANMMANSEPWITLRRDYDASLKNLTDPSKEVYLALVGDEIVGFTVLNMQGAFVGYIQSVCVAPQWRNKGIGSHLMDFLEKRIFSETPNAFICVSSFNRGVQRLYERRGYEVIGELKDFIVPGHSEILLRKTIAPLTDFKRE